MIHVKLLKIDSFQQVREHYRSLWLQSPGNKVVITLAVSIVNVCRMIDNMVTGVLQPWASRKFSKWSTKVG